MLRQLYLYVPTISWSCCNDFHCLLLVYLAKIEMKIDMCFSMLRCMFFDGSTSDLVFFETFSIALLLVFSSCFIMIQDVATIVF
jgi:hypothetical protein